MAQRKYNSRMDENLAIFTIRLGADLKAAIGNAADEAGLPMNEFIAQVMADHLGKPKLARIPRKSMGRPRKELSSRAS